MGSKQITFKEGASLNRPPLFEGEHFTFWQKRMEIFIQSIDPGAWNAIVKGPFIPTKEINGITVCKDWDELTDIEKRKVQDDQKAKNILTSGLSSDEFFRTARCKSAQEIWQLLEITHEGTADVRRARKHTLVSEYEAFRMKQGESIAEIQTRFTHIVNHLLGLGKTFEDDELNIKILNCLSKDWEAKVTAIKESKDLATMSMEALFGKLLAYEHELNQQQIGEDNEKKKRSIALKAKDQTSEASSDDEDEENVGMIVRKFNKFLKRNKDRRVNKNFRKQDLSNPTTTMTCFECGKQGHIKSDCPQYLKKKLIEKKGKRENKPRRAYIAWEDNASISSSSSDEEEEANMCLMANSNEDSETESDEEVHDSEFYELREAFNELHDEAQKLYVSNKKLKSNVIMHVNKLASLQKELNDMKEENKLLVSRLNSKTCNCETMSLNMND